MEEEGILDDGRVEETGTTLSHSSHQTMNQCEARYHFYKVLKLPHDPDANPDRYAFKFGKALHFIMELSFHTRKKFKRQMIFDAIEQQELAEEDFYRLWACSMAYYEASDESGITVVLCEMPTRGMRDLGFIDAIGIDGRGRFWIIDLKTTGWWKDLLPLRLPRDPQLSLYASHLHEIVAALRELGYDVDLDDFAGVAYRAVCKPRVVPQMGRETAAAYEERAKVKVNSIMILKEDMDIEGVVEEHAAAWRRAMELHQRVSHDFSPISAPRRNYGACVEYNRTCEYWSQCYGKTATETRKSVHVATLDKPINASNLVAHVPNINKEELDMMNVVVKETNWFPSEKAARVIIACSMGANEFSRPFYYESTEPLDAEFMNECIEKAIKEVKVQFWVHLAGLRSDSMYHHWCGLLGVKGIEMPKDGCKEEKAPAAKKEEPKPVAKPAPVKEESVDDDDAAADEPAPAPKAKAKPAPKAPDETVWVGGNKELSPLLMAELDEHLPKNWKEKAKFKEKAKEVSAALAKKKVVVLRDGEVTAEFKAMVEKLVDE